MRLLRTDVSRKDKLVSDLSEMVTKAEDLLQEAGSEFHGRIGDAKASFSEAGAAVTDKARYAAGVTDAFVRENPWKVLGVAAAVGAVVAILLTTRR